MSGRKWDSNETETPLPPKINTVITAQTGDTAFLPCHVSLREDHGVSIWFKKSLIATKKRLKKKVYLKHILIKYFWSHNTFLGFLGTPSGLAYFNGRLKSILKGWTNSRYFSWQHWKYLDVINKIHSERRRGHLWLSGWI